MAEGDRRRQEFSFTLYDFDGHGKITKDDIAGLVTTIYDTLGASIQVPPCGSKTIKVKLTVSPDQRASSSSQAPPPRSSTCLNATQTPATTTLPGNSSSCCHLKHAAPCGHTATHAARGSSRVPRRRRAPRYRCQVRPTFLDAYVRTPVVCPDIRVMCDTRPEMPTAPHGAQAKKKRTRFSLLVLERYFSLSKCKFLRRSSFDIIDYSKYNCNTIVKLAHLRAYI